MSELTEYEKLIEGVSQLANTVRVYYETLIENGFSEKDALALARDYQNALISASVSKGVI